MKRRASAVALAGGVGAARFLRGLVQILEPSELTIIVNTGDDRAFYGVQVCPDLDIVTYTLAGVIDRKMGFGLEGDTFTLVERLAELGEATWFRLGDRDYANCLYRTLRLREGAGLAEVTDRLRRAHDLACRILPMSDDPCPTQVVLSGARSVHFEEYMVRDGAPDEVEGVDLSGAQCASAAPGVVEAIEQASTIYVCPSNPVVSIGPILAVPEIGRALREIGRSREVPVVGVSPIVGGVPVKGPAGPLLRGTGAEVSARGVASLYRDWVHGFVIDEIDAEQKRDVELLGLSAAVTDTMMVDAEASARVARAAVALADELR